jgi:hypothetical protein
MKNSKRTTRPTEKNWGTEVTVKVARETHRSSRGTKEKTLALEVLELEEETIDGNTPQQRQASSESRHLENATRLGRVQAGLFQCKRTELGSEAEDRIRSTEAQPAPNGVLQRDQATVTHVPWRLLVISDHGTRQRWVLECV